MLNSINLCFKPLKIVKMRVIRYVLALLVSSLVFPCVQILLSIAQKSLVNAIEYNDNKYMSQVYILSAIILILFLIVNPIAEYMRDKTVHKYIKDLRTFVINKIIFYPIAFYERNHTGDIITKVGNDIENVSNIYRWSFYYFCIAIFYGLGSIAVMINLSWQLAIIIIVIAVLETLIMFKVSEKIKNYSQNIQGKIAKANELFIDIMKALRFIRVNSISNLMLKKYSSVSESVVKYDTKRNTRYLFMNALSDLFKAINLVGVFFIGIYLNYLGAIDLGTLMAFLILQDGVSYMINNLSSFFGSIQQSAASIERVIETINNDTEECLFENESSVMLNNYAIKGNSFSFYYDESTNCVFDGADIFIPSGKTTKIVGMSGSGKSTLVKLLMGFYPLRDGELSIGGYSYNDIGLYHVRECISYVGQTAYLFHDTIEENIRCGNDEATFNEIEQAAIKAGAHEFINEKELGYKTMVYEGGVNFSGGQRQRLTLARAFLKHAPVLLIDEATSALDQKSEFLIYKFIEDQRKEGKTILYITHKEQDYEKYDHRIRVTSGKCEISEV